MYYRYKSKKKNNAVYRTLLCMLLVLSVAFLGYRYRQYILFWKFTQNKIEARVERCAKIRDSEKRREELMQLAGHVSQHCNENPLSPASFLITGRVHFLKGETFLPGSFSEIVINDMLGDIDAAAITEFRRAIRAFHKAGALMDSDEINPDYALMLARSYYYSDFRSNKEILETADLAEKSGRINSVEDIRFYAILRILCGYGDSGIQYLQDRGLVFDTIQGRLFLATAELIAKKYTSSIMHFKEVLGKTDSSEIMKIVHRQLGRIYFNQSLYRESLKHFSMALHIDERDNILRIWIGKNYSALGMKDRARAIWSEVLTTDRTNIEVKKLLGIM